MSRLIGLISCSSEEVLALGWVEEVADVAKGTAEGSKVLGAFLRRSALSFQKAISVGLRSGEYGGKNSIYAPRRRTSSAARSPLWKPTLSRMTTSPSASSGARWV